MENWITKPFDLQLAKDIQSGKVKGRFITKDGKSVRILCFDAVNGYPIVALINNKGFEDVHSYCLNGSYLFNESKLDLQIELPEETPKYEFKVGSKVRINLPDEVLQQGIIYGNYQNKILVVKRIINEFTIEVGNSTMRPYCFPPEYLEPVKEIYEFNPFDKVLVRNNNDECWQTRTYDQYLIGLGHGCQDNLIYKQCISYEGNECLVGTTNNPK